MKVYIRVVPPAALMLTLVLAASRCVGQQTIRIRAQDKMSLFVGALGSQQVNQQGASPKPVQEEDPEDIKDVSSVKYSIGSDQSRSYRLVGLSKSAAVPAAGYKLLVVLPGGDGGDGFRWFIRRVKKNALSADVLIAQLIAPIWSPDQGKTIVWPIRPSPFAGMKFPTEQFIDDVIADVSTKTRIDPANICTFGWSSSGPPVYTHAATAKTHIRGAFVAMSVFRPGQMPDPDTVKDRRFLIYHSPQDFIKIQMAKDAVEFLTTHGAKAKLQEYDGGHGWRGNMFEDIHEGVAWLFSEEK